MSNEKHDEFSSWRSLLGSRDALSEQGLDSRDQTWEKLTRRLQPYPVARRRSLVYWMAAACLLLVLAPAMLLVRSDQRVNGRQPVDRPAAVRGTADRVEAPPAFAVRQFGHPSGRDVVLRRRTAWSRAPLKSAATPPPAVPPIPEAPTGQLPVAILQNLPVAGALPAVDSTRNRLTDKELRIVHINEIGNSDRSEPAMTSTDKRNGALDIKAVILLKTRQ
jgi:hypothetical protein